MKTFTKLNQFKFLLFLLLMINFISEKTEAQTIALWLFDEPQGLYPSHVMDDVSENDYPLVIGRSGALVKGKYGNALDATAFMELKIPDMDEARFGMGKALPIPKGRTAVPMNWENGLFTGLMASGEKHLRKQIHLYERCRNTLGKYIEQVEEFCCCFSPD